MTRDFHWHQKQTANLSPSKHFIGMGHKGMGFEVFKVPLEPTPGSQTDGNTPQTTSGHGTRGSMTRDFY